MLFEYGDTAYVVVGGLGRTENSLLSLDALVLDEELFTGVSPVKVVFDGAQVSRYLADHYDLTHMTAAEPGVAGRSNIDVVSPLLVRLGVVCLVVGAVLVGLVIESYFVKWAEVSWILGVRRYRIVYASAGFYLLASCVAFGFSLGILAFLGGSASQNRGAVLVLLALVLSLASFLGALLRRLFGKKEQWNY